ncbi:MAG: relaxase/mobilization nuclease domain-containing protein [Bacteroidota bacterium]
MIGKINPAGASFKSAVEYNIRARDSQERKDNATVLCSNMDSLNPKEIIESFQEQAKLNNKVKKPVFHAFLSFHKNDAEQLNKDLLVNIVLDYVKEMGLSQTQFAAFLHTDTEHPHIHLVANRITNNGQRYKDSMEGFRGKQICQRITKKYKLTPADHLKQGENHAIISGTKYELNPKENFKKRLKPIIQSLLKEVDSLEDFKDKIEGLDIKVKIKQDSNGKNVGISFGKVHEDGSSMWVKGSEIERQFSAKNLENAIENKNEYQTEFIESFDMDIVQSLEYEANKTTIFQGIISEDGSSIKAMIEEMKARKKDKAISRAMNRKFRKKI